MPNASNTDRVRDAVGGVETTARAGRARRPGPGARWTGWRRCSRRPPPSAGSGSPTRRGTASAAPSPAPATRASGASRSPSRPTPPPTLWDADRRRRRAAGRARRPRHAAPRGRPAAARPRARPGHHPAAGRAGLGRGVGQAGVPRPRRRCSPSASAGVRPPPRRASPPRVAGRPAPSAPIVVDGDVVGRGHERQLLARCSATASPSASSRRPSATGAAVTVDVRGTPLPGTVVPTPFVRSLTDRRTRRQARASWPRRLLGRRPFLAVGLLGRRRFFAGAFLAGAFLAGGRRFAGRRRPAPGWRAARRSPRPGRAAGGGWREREAGDAQAEQAAGLLGQLGQRRHPPAEVVDDLHELPEVGRHRAQHRRVQRVGQPGQARARPGRSASARRIDSSSAIFTVRVSCGSIARIGSSKSLSSRLTRAGRLVEVLHRRVEVLQARASAPRRPGAAGRTSGSRRRSGRRPGR